MGQQLLQERIVKQIIQLTLNSRNSTATLHEQLVAFSGTLTDGAIWEIFDTLKDGVNNITLIQEIIKSGAASPESACNILRLYLLPDTLLDLAFQAYDSNLTFLTTLQSIAERESRPWIKNRLMDRINHHRAMVYS